MDGLRVGRRLANETLQPTGATGTMVGWLWLAGERSAVHTGAPLGAPTARS